MREFVRTVENLKTEYEIDLTIPAKKNLVIIPRLVVAGLLSEQKITVEELENIKLIISEAVNLIFNSEGKINMKISLLKENDKNVLKVIISTNLTKEILENLSKSGLTIHILNYLCSKFNVHQKQKEIEIFIEKEI